MTLCGYRVPSGERCLLSMNHTEPHVIAPGEGIDMDSPGEYTCPYCGCIVSTEIRAAHQTHHEYVIGLQNRLTETEKRLENLTQQMRASLRDQQMHRGNWSDPPTYNPAGLTYDEWPVDPPFPKAKMSRKEATKVLSKPVKRKRDIIKESYGE